LDTREDSSGLKGLLRSGFFYEGAGKPTVNSGQRIGQVGTIPLCKYTAIAKNNLIGFVVSVYCFPIIINYIKLFVRQGLPRIQLLLIEELHLFSA